jgi:hypothetical protein
VGLGVWSLKFVVYGFEDWGLGVSSEGFRVQGFGFKIWGSGQASRAYDLGYGVKDIETTRYRA